jgi:hypothetical protein
MELSKTCLGLKKGRYHLLCLSAFLSTGLERAKRGLGSFDFARHAPWHTVMDGSCYAPITPLQEGPTSKQARPHSCKMQAMWPSRY